METVSVNLISVAILLTLVWLGLFVIPIYLFRRAIFQVVRIFRISHSLCSETPKRVEELGLTPPTLTERLTKSRDYKPYALQFLLKSGVVQQDQDGSLCLLEGKLDEFLHGNR